MDKYILNLILKVKIKNLINNPMKAKLITDKIEYFGTALAISTEIGQQL
jgi:hypothetical protein